MLMVDEAAKEEDLEINNKDDSQTKAVAKVPQAVLQVLAILRRHRTLEDHGIRIEDSLEEFIDVDQVVLLQRAFATLMQNIEPGSRWFNS